MSTSSRRSHRWIIITLLCLVEVALPFIWSAVFERFVRPGLEARGAQPCAMLSPAVRQETGDCDVAFQTGDDQLTHVVAFSRRGRRRITVSVVNGSVTTALHEYWAGWAALPIPFFGVALLAAAAMRKMLRTRSLFTLGMAGHPYDATETVLLTYAIPWMCSGAAALFILNRF